MATSCRSGGPTGRRRARTGSSAGTTRPASGSRSGPTRGSASSSRPGSGSAGAPRRRRRPRSPRSRRTTDGSRSSASARATCTRSRSRIASSSTGASSTATTPRGARRVRRRRQLLRARRHVLLRLDGDRATGRSGFDIALTEILDGEHRLLAETDRAGAEVLAELPTRSGGAARRGRCRGGGRRRRRADGPDDGGGDLRDLLADNLEHRALGRRRRPLPHLRQLRARLSHVLLLERRGPHRPDRGGRALADVGHASRSTTRTSTAAASGRAAAPATGNG